MKIIENSLELMVDIPIFKLNLAEEVLLSTSADRYHSIDLFKE